MLMSVAQKRVILMQRDPEQTEVRNLQAIADFKDAHILEVGCGDGRLTWRYAHHTHQVTAIDPNPLRLAIALRTCPPSLRNTVTFLRSEAERLPFADYTFDGALLAWSL